MLSAVRCGKLLYSVRMAGPSVTARLVGSRVHVRNQHPTSTIPTRTAHQNVAAPPCRKMHLTGT